MSNASDNDRLANDRLANFQLFIFHELRRRFADLEIDDEDLHQDQARSLIIETLNQLPGIKATGNDASHIEIENSGKSQLIQIQNIIDGLCILWNEYRQSLKQAANQ